MDKTLPKLSVPADLSYTGDINYTIAFTGQEVSVNINNPSVKNSAAIFAFAANHLQRLVNENRENPGLAKKKFTDHERQSIKAAEWILTRISNAQLGQAYAEIKNPVVSESPTKA